MFENQRRAAWTQASRRRPSFLVAPLAALAQTLPVVLSPAEVAQFLACVPALKHRS